MQFGFSQQLKFNAKIGAYSIVTQREYIDSQITATDSEASLLIHYFGQENIHVGNVKSDPVKSAKNFWLYPNGETISLNLVFPKPNKSELRLYISKSAAFKPPANSIWFMFEREQGLWIGSMSEAQWRDENYLIVYDETEALYQDAIAELDAIKMNTYQARDVYSRDRNLALARFKAANYQCEYDATHKLFTSRQGLPYLEAHHLVPMALQKITPKKLDIIENIFSLCPYCHRAVHHANKDLTRDIITKLVAKRPETVDILGFNGAEIFGFYSVEDIY